MAPRAQLRVATIARNGAGTIDAAQRKVMYGGAQDAGRQHPVKNLSVATSKTLRHCELQAAR